MVGPEKEAGETGAITSLVSTFRIGLWRKGLRLVSPAEVAARRWTTLQADREQRLVGK